MKTHKTITITARFLERLDACKRGVEKIRHLLPASISTDPEQNIALAIEIAEIERSTETGRADTWWLAAGWADTWWLAARVLEDVAGYCLCTLRGWPDSYNFDNDSNNPEADPFVVAQYLAWAADALLADQGK